MSQDPSINVFSFLAFLTIGGQKKYLFFELYEWVSIAEMRVTQCIQYTHCHLAGSKFNCNFTLSTTKQADVKANKPISFRISCQSHLLRVHFCVSECLKLSSKVEDPSTYGWIWLIGACCMFSEEGRVPAETLTQNPQQRWRTGSRGHRTLIQTVALSTRCETITTKRWIKFSIVKFLYVLWLCSREGNLAAASWTARCTCRRRQVGWGWLALKGISLGHWRVIVHGS